MREADARSLLQARCATCRDTGEVAATPGQPGDGSMPCPTCGGSLIQARKPRLLDLFCGAGGAAMGYMRAGFYVVGVDIAPQPHYCGDMFIHADVFDVFAAGFWLIGGIEDFAAIHASPPCQHYSDLAYRNGNADAHPDLIGATRELLEDSGLPYVIENVEGAPLRDPIRLCATERGLGAAGYRLRRHRLVRGQLQADLARLLVRD